MALESGGVHEDWRFDVIIPQYKGKGERTECKNYRCISLLSVVGKIQAGILVETVCRVTGGLMMSKVALEQEVGVQIRQSHQIMREKMQSVCGFYRFGGV